MCVLSLVVVNLVAPAKPNVTTPVSRGMPFMSSSGHICPLKTSRKGSGSQLRKWLGTVHDPALPLLTRTKSLAHNGNQTLPLHEATSTTCQTLRSHGHTVAQELQHLAHELQLLVH